MKSILLLLGVLLETICIANAQISEPNEYAPTLLLKTSESFYISVNEGIFNNSDFGVDDSPIKYRPSLMSMPDLPKWMRFMYSDFYHDGFIYGVPERSEDVTIEVIATNTETFQTRRRLVHFAIRERQVRAAYEVQMKFSNLNVDEMFVNDRLERLAEIFSRRLWKGAREMYVTMVESAVRMGGRRPQDPREKDGVVVRIGSVDDFSRELKNLEREVLTLHNRDPCPKDYKKTSAERFFRDEEFIPDWCGFRLLSDGKGSYNSQEPAFSPILLTSNDFHPPTAMMASRDLLTDFLLCIILPTTLAFVLAAALSFIMFGRREGVEKRNRETPSVQMVQYASIHRASNNLRSLTSKREGTTPLATTPSSTLPRSYGGSPNNTMTKSNTLRKIDNKSVYGDKINQSMDFQEKSKLQIASCPGNRVNRKKNPILKWNYGMSYATVPYGAPSNKMKISYPSCEKKRIDIPSSSIAEISNDSMSNGGLGTSDASVGWRLRRGIPFQKMKRTPNRDKACFMNNEEQKNSKQSQL